jgi:hypothetical protein
VWDSVVRESSVDRERGENERESERARESVCVCEREREREREHEYISLQSCHASFRNSRKTPLGLARNLVMMSRNCYTYERFSLSLTCFGWVVAQRSNHFTQLVHVD